MAGRPTPSSACAFYHPDDPAELKAEQAQKLRTLYEAARKVGRELLVEIIAGKHGALDDDTVARALAELYALGIKPDWWKLEPQATSAAWAQYRSRDQAPTTPIAAASCLLGLEAPEEELEPRFRAAAGHAARQGLRRRPHDLRAKLRRKTGCAATSAWRR